MIHRFKCNIYRTQERTHYRIYMQCTAKCGIQWIQDFAKDDIEGWI